ncbi:AfsR/SARP family transcriptional regulator [Streptomyces sp. WM6378]|uniref:AfsR/SARP family transcriptional regulator n=1 Tax=Streptomyces sp. WM6378 TaxID=1415557 RepID=UPI0006AE5EB5|nr:AfsR/SARP family transcriptional regulator [Streptomyces sp. WM6378]
MEFRLLGTFEVRDEERVLDVGPRLRQLTLAVLLLEANRPVRVERLMSLLWDGEPPSTARNSLHGHISRLRRLLADTPGVSLRTHGAAYALHVDPADVDALRFRALAERARDIPDEPGAALLRQALGLWRGDMLTGLADDRVRRQLCMAWAESRMTAYERCLDAELRLGRHDGLLGELTELACDHPTRERFTAQLLIALYRSGRPGDAIAAYRRAKTVLAQEFGLEPGTELQGLAMAVLRADPGLAAPACSFETASTAFGPPSVIPRQLTSDTVHFTGREESLARLDAVLGGGTGRCAVVCGTAGVGKTALVVHWAHGVASRFPDGQLYADLRGWSTDAPLTASEVLVRFLRALGVPSAQIPMLGDEQAALYRSLLADRRVLIVLDNARSAEQIRPLLPGSPHCAVAVTSRADLHELVAFDDAVPIGLQLLHPDAALTLLSRIVGSARVEAQPAEAADLARLCAWLPLALRTAAGRLATRPSHTIGHLVAELVGDTPLSGLAPPGEPPSTLRAAFDLSYGGLDPALRAAFRKLGLAPGPDFTPNAAAALWGVPEEAGESVLAALHSAHLVHRPTPGRYGLHDLLHDYARERADAEESPERRQEALGRLLDWYLRHADAAVRELFPGFLRLPSTAAGDTARPVVFPEEADARAWLEAEAPSIVASIQHTSVHGPLEAAWQLADALRGFFWLHGRYTDWLTAARAGLHAARTAGDERAQAVMHHGLGHACRQLAQYPEALEHLTKALHIHRRFDWREGEAITLGNLGMVHAEQGRLTLAIDHHLRAKALHRETGARASEAIALNNLGDAYRALGDTDAALRHHRASLDISRGAGFRQSEVQAAIGLAATHLHEGQVAEALDRVHDAVTAARSAGFLPLEGRALTVLGQAHRSRGAPREARLYWQQALDIFTGLNSPEAHQLRSYLGLPDA